MTQEITLNKLPMIQPTFRTLMLLDVDGVPVKTAADAIAAVVKLIANDATETAVGIALGANKRPLYCQTLDCGKLTGATFDIRSFIRLAITTNAQYLILVHNHPSGIVEPSKTDVEQVEALNFALALIGTQLLDSVICGPDYKNPGEIRSYSLATHKKYRVVGSDKDLKKVLTDGEQRLYKKMVGFGPVSDAYKRDACAKIEMTREYDNTDRFEEIEEGKQ